MGVEGKPGRLRFDFFLFFFFSPLFPSLSLDLFRFLRYIYLPASSLHLNFFYLFQKWFDRCSC